MEVTAVKDKVELWIEEGHKQLQQRFQYELTKQERAIFVWNANVLLSMLIKKRGRI